MLKIEKVSLKKKKKVILEAVDLQVAQGEVCVIIGEEGAGKTTLCKVLANVITPDSGTITINDLVKNTYSHSQVGALLEPMVFDPTLKVKTLLKEKCAYMQVKKAKGHITELAALLGIEDLLKRRVQSLSQGEYQLVKLALAFVGYPSLVVLDDPFAHLDQLSIKKVKALIEECTKQEMTFLLTMRDDALLSKMKTSTYYMRDGHLTKHQVDLSPSVVLALNTAHQDEAMIALKAYHPRLLKGLILMDVFTDDEAYTINQLLVCHGIDFDELTFIHAQAIHERGGVHYENDQH